MTDSAETIAWFGFSLTHHRTNAVFPSTPTNGLGTEEVRRRYGMQEWRENEITGNILKYNSLKNI